MPVEDGNVKENNMPGTMKKTKMMGGGMMKKPMMKKGGMSKLNPGLKAYLAKKKKKKK